MWHLRQCRLCVISPLWAGLVPWELNPGYRKPVQVCKRVETEVDLQLLAGYWPSANATLEWLKSYSWMLQNGPRPYFDYESVERLGNSPSFCLRLLWESLSSSFSQKEWAKGSELRHGNPVQKYLLFCFTPFQPDITSLYPDNATVIWGREPMRWKSVHPSSSINHSITNQSCRKGFPLSV